ncbi:hypothetical protein M9H77_23567 [Catharanthus roseus]|uniref:Uncharacterized protein n=1 Tax=Catharanthus roseus TaxID=4058 RepID=A0ACC0AVT6_CATRO|nr:hypothetical protein M9H77_23567 [Catharanthus roseus]
MLRRASLTCPDAELSESDSNRSFLDPLFQQQGIQLPRGFQFTSDLLEHLVENDPYFITFLSTICQSFDNLGVQSSSISLSRRQEKLSCGFPARSNQVRKQEYYNDRVPEKHGALRLQGPWCQLFLNLFLPTPIEKILAGLIERTCLRHITLRFLFLPQAQPAGPPTCTPDSGPCSGPCQNHPNLSRILGANRRKVSVDSSARHPSTLSALSVEIPSEESTNSRRGLMVLNPFKKIKRHFSSNMELDNDHKSVITQYRARRNQVFFFCLSGMLEAGFLEIEA